MNFQMSISTDNTLVSLLTFFYEKGLSLRILIVLSKTGFELEKHIKFITIKHTSLSFFKSMCELNGNIYDYIFSRKKTFLNIYLIKTYLQVWAVNIVYSIRLIWRSCMCVIWRDITTSSDVLIGWSLVNIWNVNGRSP